MSDYMNNTRIPKIIHYCWFGGAPLPELAKRCIESWKKHCPDYEIMRWDENNFDINFNTYVHEAYAARKWAFVSDVARLHALVTHGGIYMDTDVEVIRNLDTLLDYEALSGFEAPNRIPTGLMACQQGQEMFRKFLEDYDNEHFILSDGSLNQTTNVVKITNYCLKHGLTLNNTIQTINGFTLFPCDYFCPKDCETRKLHLSKNTYTIHHFDGSWKSDEDKCARAMAALFMRLMPQKAAKYLAKFMAIAKHRGLRAALSETYRWVS